MMGMRSSNSPSMASASPLIVFKLGKSSLFDSRFLLCGLDCECLDSVWFT